MDTPVASSSSTPYDLFEPFHVTGQAAEDAQEAPAPAGTPTSASLPGAKVKAKPKARRRGRKKLDSTPPSNVIIACVPCRNAHTSCSGTSLPCARCIRRGTEEECVAAGRVGRGKPLTRKGNYLRNASVSRAKRARGDTLPEIDETEVPWRPTPPTAQPKRSNLSEIAVRELTGRLMPIGADVHGRCACCIHRGSTCDGARPCKSCIDRHTEQDCLQNPAVDPLAPYDTRGIVTPRSFYAEGLDPRFSVPADEASIRRAAELLIRAHNASASSQPLPTTGTRSTVDTHPQSESSQSEEMQDDPPLNADVEQLTTSEGPAADVVSSPLTPIPTSSPESNTIALPKRRSRAGRARNRAGEGSDTEPEEEWVLVNGVKRKRSELEPPPDLRGQWYRLERMRIDLSKPDDRYPQPLPKPAPQYKEETVRELSPLSPEMPPWPRYGSTDFTSVPVPAGLRPPFPPISELRAPSIDMPPVLAQAPAPSMLPIDSQMS